MFGSPVSCCQGPEFLFSGEGWRRIIHDALYLELDLSGWQEPARAVHPQSEVASSVVHRHKLTVLPVLQNIWRADISNMRDIPQCCRTSGGQTYGIWYPTVLSHSGRWPTLTSQSGWPIHKSEIAGSLRYTTSVGAWMVNEHPPVVECGRVYLWKCGGGSCSVIFWNELRNEINSSQQEKRACALPNSSPGVRVVLNMRSHWAAHRGITVPGTLLCEGEMEREKAERGIKWSRQGDKEKEGKHRLMEDYEVWRQEAEHCQC